MKQFRLLIWNSLHFLCCTDYLVQKKIIWLEFYLICEQAFSAHKYEIWDIGFLKKQFFKIWFHIYHVLIELQESPIFRALSRIWITHRLQIGQLSSHQLVDLQPDLSLHFLPLLLFDELRVMLLWKVFSLITRGPYT